MNSHYRASVVAVVAAATLTGIGACVPAHATRSTDLNPAIARPHATDIAPGVIDRRHTYTPSMTWWINRLMWSRGEPPRSIPAGTEIFTSPDGLWRFAFHSNNAITSLAC